ncbi:RagB/SusD family nutrient uptake outer membrane protein [Chitinophaga pendula]|uniref:RagB/SusD family nutrient uptake outer membrane protein n=1 Tax=Chitinophaga TaxID=79328 RepID=UPI000BAEE480|nr:MULTISPECIES: RagB/SusD family nutrient uptake outer membrane protein [Chitinophaga]ASZ11596.1 RagB/SusD family nutrient uptake outer membrane protein [Chitinophaga sp. MD30]UCJ05394.1 RagB/SusD family nutrient uptake outer membrane protein [Chitinophaga pendula]
MKVKYISYITLLAAGMQLASSCSKSFIEVDPKGTFLEDNYYRNQQEAFNGLVAVYDIVGWQSSGYITKIGALNAASDDNFAGGGGPNDVSDFQVFSNYTLTPATGPQSELWRKGYSGVFRANILLQKMPGVNMDDNLKKRYIAEAKFLRAYFYFDLVRLFKSIPLFTVPVKMGEETSVTQALPADVYKLIEQDLKDAFTDLPARIDIKVDGGRATKAAAQALLGKVYLQQKKYPQAITELAAVNGTPGGESQYGNKLLTNYADLFLINNKFNAESIFELVYTNTSVGSWGCVACTEGNVLGVMVGPRNYNRKDQSAPDYVSGWSFLPVTEDLFNAMQGDPRLPATIANLKALEAAGKVTYEKGYMNTGYFMEKFAGRESYKWTGSGNWELNFPRNMYDMRLADTYLLEAEALILGGGDLGRAAALINAVRDRAYGDNLHHVAATMENLKKERRLELAGEGHRWLDLVRWGDAATVLGGRGFQAGKHEILPIPLLEMENTKLEQTKEWGGTK